MKISDSSFDRALDSWILCDSPCTYLKGVQYHHIKPTFRTKMGLEITIDYQFISINGRFENADRISYHTKTAELYEDNYLIKAYSEKIEDFLTEEVEKHLQGRG